MKCKIFMFVFSFTLFISCKKEVGNLYTIEGVITDDASGAPLSGVDVRIDAIKAPSSMGILSDGKRETVGKTVTDANGFYQIKAHIFKEAQDLEFNLNEINKKEGYVNSQKDVYMESIQREGVNNVNFTLSPTAFLTIEFKNASPVNDSDYFNFYVYYNANGWVTNPVRTENCGTVAEYEAGGWFGENVCGSRTVEVVAEKGFLLTWYVTRNHVDKQYSDSVSLKHNEHRKYVINY